MDDAHIIADSSSITWLPIVFTFSFTGRELQKQPLTTLSERFERLDIKLLTDYHTAFTTHVISKKRNTAKGLQALINGKYIVTETFLDAIDEVTEVLHDAGAAGSCPLEEDFDKHWPEAMRHLPPPGGEPVQHPDAAYAPDLGRKDVFDGYIFVFYEQVQFNNLLAPITNGSGKALLHVVTPGKSEVDDFIRYVKSVAGEKGLGSFEDGSEGKGVVLVRYIPSKGEHIGWYTVFFREVSMRLDHRPIEQSEFLEAILINDASILRRSLEAEPTPQPRESQRPSQVGRDDLANGHAVESAACHEQELPQQSNNYSRPATRRPITRSKVKRRFAGFDGDDAGMDEPSKDPRHGLGQPPVSEEEDGLFVSDEVGNSQEQRGHRTEKTSRKRQASALPQEDVMEALAPAVVRFKRQQMESGRRFASPSPAPDSTLTSHHDPKKGKAEIDVLAMAAQHCQEEEARAQAEKDDLARLPDDVDLSEIRRLNLVEEMEVRQPAGPRTRDRDVAEGRWNPKWNGMKNFKKFRQRGETMGRQPARIIVQLTEAKDKEYGVGDDYWLEDKSTHGKSKGSASFSVSEPHGPMDWDPLSSERPRRWVGAEASGTIEEEETDEQDAEMVDASHSRLGSAPRTRQTRLQAAKEVGKSQSSSRASASGRHKRPSPGSDGSGPPHKRPKQAPKGMGVVEVDDSDDDLQFRFGTRR